MMKGDGECCVSCRYWDLKRNGTAPPTEGRCRRMPPHDDRSWYTTSAWDWCGEHRPDPTELERLAAEAPNVE